MNSISTKETEQIVEDFFKGANRLHILEYLNGFTQLGLIKMVTLLANENPCLLIDLVNNNLLDELEIRRNREKAVQEAYNKG